MKKRFAVLLTAGLIAFSFSGCQQKAADTATEETEAVVVVETEEAEPAKEPEPETEEVQETETEPEVPVETETEELTETEEGGTSEVRQGGFTAPDQGYRIDNHVNEVYAETEPDVLLYSTDYDTITITREGLEPLKESVAAWNEENRKKTEEADYLDGVDELYHENEGGQWIPFSISGNVSVGRFDDTVFSIKESEYFFTGGAHGETTLYGKTFDTSSGQLLTFDDIAADVAELKSFSSYYIKDYVNKVYNLGEVPYTFDGWEAEVDSYLEEPKWYFNDYGLVYLIDTYTLGPHAMGNVEATVPYSELGGRIKDQYMRQSKAFTYQFNFGEEVIVDDSGNKLSVISESDDTNYLSTVTLQFGEEAIVAAQDAQTVSNPWVVKEEDGRVYVMIETGTYTDDGVEYTHILYMLQNGGFQKLDEIKERGVTYAAEVEAIVEGLT